MADNVEKLAKLAELYEKGLLSREEFDREKTKVQARAGEAPLPPRDSRSSSEPPIAQVGECDDRLTWGARKLGIVAIAGTVAVGLAIVSRQLNSDTKGL